MTKVVRISKEIAEDLALRDSADRLFNSIEASKEKEVVIDFSEIRTISRSFAHQYTLRKRDCNKYVTETNVPQNVQKMFRVVSEPAPKPHLVDLRGIRVVAV